MFKNHWKIITDNITDNGIIIINGCSSVTSTNAGSIGIIEERLEAMLELLCSEEKLGDFKDPGTVVTKLCCFCFVVFVIVFAPLGSLYGICLET